MPFGVKNIDFSEKTIKNSNFSPFSWCIASDLSLSKEYSVVKDIIEGKELIRKDPNISGGQFSAVYDLQFKTYFIYNEYGINMEPLFNHVESRGDKGFSYTLNPKVSNVINSHNAVQFITPDNPFKDYLSKYLFFNFATLSKVSLTLKVDDIRKLLFMENKYSSAGDLHNKVIKKILSQIPININCYAVPSSNRTINSFIFQRG